MVNHRFQLTRRHSHSKTVKKTDARGFTIIEIMIVLAIAGLIMLIVFLAIPAVQRSARNDERKRVAHLVATQLIEYRNFNGSYPETASDGSEFIDSYLKQVTPRFDVVFFVFSNGHDYLPPEDEIAIEFGHWCNRHGNGNNATDPIASAINGDKDRLNYAVWTVLEPNNIVYCIDAYGA